MAEEPIPHPEPPSNQALKDLFAGAVGGVAQVLIGQPFGMTPQLPPLRFSPPCLPAAVARPPKSLVNRP